MKTSSRLVLRLHRLSVRPAQVGHYHGINFFRPRRTEDIYDDKSGKVVLKKETYQEYEKLKSQHDKDEQQQRKQAQNDFFTGKTNVMVANDAFGQGINNPDIHLVIHYGPPKGMEQYMNQFGRAGRDGERANCVLFCEPSDFNKHESNIRNDQKKKVIEGPAASAQVSPSFEKCAVHLYYSTCCTADRRLMCMCSYTR